MLIESNASQRFAHILWIGGSPCAGKSSIARILAHEYGLRTYSCDDAYDSHISRAVPNKYPLMSRAAGLTWDEVWMRPVDVMVTQELAFYREEFEMVMEDLLAMPGSSPILAEGAALLPECVAPLLFSLTGPSGLCQARTSSAGSTRAESGWRRSYANANPQKKPGTTGWGVMQALPE